MIIYIRFTTKQIPTNLVSILSSFRGLYLSTCYQINNQRLILNNLTPTVLFFLHSNLGNNHSNKVNLTTQSNKQNKLRPTSLHLSSSSFFQLYKVTSQFSIFNSRLFSKKRATKLSIKSSLVFLLVSNWCLAPQQLFPRGLVC